MIATAWFVHQETKKKNHFSSFVDWFCTIELALHLVFQVAVQHAGAISAIHYTTAVRSDGMDRSLGRKVDLSICVIFI